MARMDVYRNRLQQETSGQFSPRDITLLHHLASYIRPHLGFLAIGSVAMLCALGLELWRPIIVKQVIDSGFTTHNSHIIQSLTLLYFITILGSILVIFLQNMALKTFGQRIIYELREKIFSLILHKSEQEFSDLPLGNWVTRVTNDVEACRTLYTDVIVKLVYNALFILGILGFMYYLNVYLALVMTALIPLMGVLTFVYQKFSRKAFRQLRTQIASSNSSVQEFLNCIVIVKTYVAETLVEKTYREVNRKFLEAGLFEVKTFAIFRPLVDALFFVALLAIFIFTNLFDSVTEAGIVFAFIQYMDKFFQPMKEIAEKYNSLQSALSGAERLVPLLEEANQAGGDGMYGKAQELPPELHPVETIAFDHVWYSYEGDDQYALQDITLTIQGGDFIGIVGPSGSGKSTLMSLLTGVLRPTKGRILINGYDIIQYDSETLRLLMAYVFQDVHLFKGTIQENLTLYDDSISRENLLEVVKKVGLQETINQLPQRYDTSVGYLGSLLSAGQRQLLTFGRAMLKGAPILLLDEATANIDSYTEQMIQGSLEGVRGEVTIINVAHRLSTVCQATCIYVLEEGRLVEWGRFSELLVRNGRFAQLWNYQQG